MILNRKIKAKGAALIMTVLLLAFFSLMAVMFSTMLSLHLGQSKNYLHDSLLESGESAVLAHALALCDNDVSNSQLFGKVFSSGWTSDSNNELSYRFYIKDQLKDELFGFAEPLTAVRERNGQEKVNLSVMDSEDPGSAFLKENCVKILEEEKRPAEEAAGIVDRLLDKLDVNRDSRENDLEGESLAITGITKGDNRIFTPIDILTLSSFFDLNREKLEPCRYFIVGGANYEDNGGVTNLFVSMWDRPYGNEEQKAWEDFRQLVGDRIGNLWTDWEWEGKDVSFLSACGGKYIKAKILEARSNGFLLEGTPEVTLGCTLTRSWCNRRDEPGSLKLQAKSTDLWVIQGLQTNFYYRFKLRQVQGHHTRPIFDPDGIMQTGDFYKVITGKRGQLAFSLTKTSRDALFMGIEMRSPEYCHFENISSSTLNLRDWSLFCETPEGLTLEVKPEWGRHPVLKPGDKMDLMSWVRGDAGKHDLIGFAPQAAWAVPAKIRSKRLLSSELGYYASIVLETNSNYEREDHHIRHGFVYLGPTRKCLMPFPIANQDKGSLTVFLGPKQYARDWYRQLGDKIYFGDFQIEMLRNKNYICDQWGQKTTLLTNPDRVPWMVGYHKIKNKETNQEDLEKCLSKFAQRKTTLPFSGRISHLTETRCLAIPSGGNKLVLHKKPAYKENFWKDCDLVTSDGEVFRIMSSKGASVTLDRNHKLKKDTEVLITPDGLDNFLAGPMLPERVWTLKLPKEALLPGDLYLPGHSPLPNVPAPEYTISVYNGQTDKWELRAENASFPKGDVLHLGRITRDHRLPKGEIKIKIVGKGAGANGYWLRQPFLISDNMFRKDKSERCDSFAVYYEVKATDKTESEPITRKGAFLIQRQWERGSKHPKSFFAAKSSYFKPFE